MLVPSVMGGNCSSSHMHMRLVVSSFRPSPPPLPVFLRPLPPMLNDTKGRKGHLIRDPVSAVIEIDMPRGWCRYIPPFVIANNAVIIEKVLIVVHSHVDLPQLLQALPLGTEVKIVHAIVNVSRCVLDRAGQAYPIGAISAALRSMFLSSLVLDCTFFPSAIRRRRRSA